MDSFPRNNLVLILHFKWLNAFVTVFDNVIYINDLNEFLFYYASY